MNRIPKEDDVQRMRKRIKKREQSSVSQITNMMMNPIANECINAFKNEVDNVPNKDAALEFGEQSSETPCNVTLV